MAGAATHRLSLPGPMLRRGFWLYVWDVETPCGQMLYVGRTGDNSSPHATAPYTRMGQHLGFAPNQNALRRQLTARNINPEDCARFDLVAHGPIHDEVSGGLDEDRTSLMARHLPLRNLVGAMEKALADELKQVGYDVMNSVSWRFDYDPATWQQVRAAFAQSFPKLEALR
ncbi:MAG: hypothetical protein EOP62_00400 [Sphingomonadales bacterium]|nr:MAG: hypothetical protein EOP62_00400 [Sphingomonadales bacterium]